MKSTNLLASTFSDEDILADSDSDDSDDDKLQEDILMDSSGQPSAERSKKKAHRKDEKYIHEDADTIIDLADIKAMSKISCKLTLSGA